jgi:hypothetical protein
MSVSSSDQLGDIAARRARAGADPRNGDPAATPELSPSDSHRRPRAVRDLPQEQVEDRQWDERVEREVRHQEVVEATSIERTRMRVWATSSTQFEWLDRAAAVNGGLARAHRARRRRWVRTPAIQPGRRGAKRNTRFGRAGAGAGP